MKQTLEKLSGVLRDKGYNITHQRLVVYKALMESKEHPSAEELYRHVRKSYPIISLGTVYKSLEMFEKLGLIQKVNYLYNTARYDANVMPHGHLVCKSCNQVVDLVLDEIPHIPIPEGEKGDFDVDTVVVQFLGHCKQCRKKKSNSGN